MLNFLHPSIVTTPLPAHAMTLASPMLSTTPHPITLRPLFVSFHLSADL